MGSPRTTQIPNEGKAYSAVGEPQVVLQGFCPDSIVAITGDSAWTPPAGAVAFRVPQACGYYFDALSTNSGSLQAGAVTMIAEEITSITFDTTMKIEVM